jgi:DNA-binding NarL/FixJ family response regulator
MCPTPVSAPDRTSRRVRILLVEDMPQVLHDLRELLELTGRFEIVGEARDGAEAVRLAGALSPEAVILDLEIPRLDGYEAAHLIKELPSPPRVIILSAHAGPEEQQRARAAGADGFVMKGDRYEVLVNAILGREYPPDPDTPEKGTKS